MKLLVVLAGLAMLTTLYQTEADRLDNEAFWASEQAAESVRDDLQYEMDEQERRLDDLEESVVTQW